MKPLVLLILAAVWAAVLLPPLLRNRVENRPNSSVTDFRRQLNKLQNTVPSRSGSHVSMARPLAPSPLSRPAANGRPGDALRRQHGDPRARRAASDRGAVRERSPQPQRYARSHGDRSAMLRRPAGSFERPAPGNTPPRGRRRPTDTGRAAHRQTQVHRDPRAADVARRRRSNVLVGLVVVTFGTLFFAAQTRSTALLYTFALSFVALCGYLYMLNQSRSREAQQWGNDWLE